jgi:Chaperone of endosialidase
MEGVAMLARMRPGLTHASVLVSVVAAFLGLGSGAYAATSFVGAGGTVRGCVSKKGQLTLVKRGKKCGRGVTAISWNQKGPAGQAGAQGSKGDPGPSTGPAGGALAGTYPNPTLNVTGGPCARGQFVNDLSNLSALTCGPLTPFTALGQGALASNTGVGNSAFGRNALTANTMGSSNTAVGSAALATNNTGSNNSALGQDALVLNTSGASNSAFGRDALFTNDSGAFNTALGHNALTSNTSGASNSALGVDALDSSMTGGSNVAAGQDAGSGLISGSSNALFGTGAGNAFAGAESSNVEIANAGVAGENNTIRIGTQGAGAGEQNQTFLAGVNGASVNQNTAVLVGSDGKLGTAMASSRRFKTDIRPLGRMHGLMRLRPVSYRYKARWADGNHSLQYGLIAEQVAKVFPALVQRGPDGKPNGVRYGDLPVLLLAQLRREHAHARHQQHEIDRQQGEIDRLAARLHLAPAREKAGK